MNKEIKEKWLKALRSGRYKQTRGALRRPKNANETNEYCKEGYCCLGVLCRVVAPNVKWMLGHTNYYSFLGETALPPFAILKEADITPEDEKAFYELPAMNDGGDDFKKIADYIEANL